MCQVKEKRAAHVKYLEQTRWPPGSYPVRPVTNRSIRLAPLNERSVQEKFGRAYKAAALNASNESSLGLYYAAAFRVEIIQLKLMLAGGHHKTENSRRRRRRNNKTKKNNKKKNNAEYKGNINNADKERRRRTMTKEKTEE